ATITASFGGLNASTSLTVSSPPLTAIQITPTSPTIPQGTAIQFTAIGSYSDGTSINVTNQVSWGSSNSGVATVSTGGVGSTTATGSTLISASLNGVNSNAATLTVVKATVLGTTAQPRYLYTANYNNNSIGGFSIDGSTGVLTGLSGFPMAAPAGANYIWEVVVDPSNRYLYATDRNGGKIYGYVIDAGTGALALVDTIAASGPQWMMIDPSGRYLYVTTYSGIQGYSIDSSSGMLTAIAGGPWTGCSYTTVAVSSGSLYQGCGRSVYAYQINSGTGALTAVAGSPFSNPTTSNGWSTALDGKGRFLYVANQESNNGTSVSAYTVDGTTGVLTLVTGSPFATGQIYSGTYVLPVSMAEEPTGTFVYVATAENGSSVVNAFVIDQATGALTGAPGAGFATGYYAQDPVVDPSGRFLYVGVPGNYQVSGASLDMVTGNLTGLSGSPYYASGPAVALAISGATLSSTATLTSLQVTPANPTILSSTLGKTQQFMAVATYSDGTQQYLTTSATWSVDNPSIATITAGGLATTVGFGTATITASFGGLNASTSLTVT